RSAGPWLLYFSAIGFGFMCVEISQMQRLIVFLGHPVYGLTVLLFALLVSSGVGSALTPRIESIAAARRQAWRLALLVAVLLVFGLVTPSAIEMLGRSRRRSASRWRSRSWPRSGSCSAWRSRSGSAPPRCATPA